MSASLHSLMIEPTAAADRPALLRQLLSFLAIGGTAALAFVALSMTMIALLPDLPSWIVSTGCYAAFVGPVYLAHRRFTFRSGVPHREALPRYVAVQVTALSLASLFSYLCYGLLGLPTLVAAVVVIGLTSGVNFIVLKLWAFAQRA
jgi:putative flippase GtrA